MFFYLKAGAARKVPFQLSPVLDVDFFVDFFHLIVSLIYIRVLRILGNTEFQYVDPIGAIVYILIKTMLTICLDLSVAFTTNSFS